MASRVGADDVPGEHGQVGRSYRSGGRQGDLELARRVLGMELADPDAGFAQGADEPAGVVAEARQDGQAVSGPGMGGDRRPVVVTMIVAAEEPFDLAADPDLEVAQARQIGHPPGEGTLAAAE